MASEERQAANNKIKEANFFKSLGAEEQQAETDAFQCSRCKQVGIHHSYVPNTTHSSFSFQRKCRYRQAQTRSADEPMTVSNLSSRLSPHTAKLRIPDFRYVRILFI